MSETRKGWRVLGGGLLVLALGYWSWTNRQRLFVNDVTTGESSSYPTLRSRVYYTDIATAMTAAEQTLRRLPRWKLVERDSENNALEAEVRTVAGPFTDDVTVYFFSLGHGQTRVTIRSRSRLGRTDFGQNAAHIRALQGVMDDRLNAGAAF